VEVVEVDGAVNDQGLKGAVSGKLREDVGFERRLVKRGGQAPIATRADGEGHTSPVAEQILAIARRLAVGEQFIETGAHGRNTDSRVLWV
jgi:hypothetical protein